MRHSQPIKSHQARLIFGDSQMPAPNCFQHCVQMYVLGIDPRNLCMTTQRSRGRSACQTLHDLTIRHVLIKFHLPCASQMRAFRIYMYCQILAQENMIEIFRVRQPGIFIKLGAPITIYRPLYYSGLYRQLQAKCIVIQSCSNIIVWITTNFELGLHVNFVFLHPSCCTDKANTESSKLHVGPTYLALVCKGFDV